MPIWLGSWSWPAIRVAGFGDSVTVSAAARFSPVVAVGKASLPMIPCPLRRVWAASTGWAAFRKTPAPSGTVVTAGEGVFSSIEPRTAVRAGTIPCALALPLRGDASGTSISRAPGTVMTGKPVFSSIEPRTAVRAGAISCVLALPLSAAASGALRVPETPTLVFVRSTADVFAVFRAALRIVAKIAVEPPALVFQLT